MFFEEEAVFADEVREARLPAGTAHARGHALAVRQGGEAAFEAERRAKVFKEIVALIGAPQFGKDQDIGAQVLHFIKHARWSAPPVDAGVKVKGGDTHRSTLARALGLCGSL